MPKEIVALIVFDVLFFTPFLLMYLYPPKDIGPWGHRTKRSTKNIDNWNFSQKYSARLFLRTAIIVISTQLLLLFFVDIDLKKEPPLIPIITLLEIAVGGVFCVLSTEAQLKGRENKKDDIEK